jgi:hypothetical protein
MDREDQRRVAANEALFREVNEGIQRGQWPGDDSEPFGYRCECGRLGCNALVTLTPREYERIRGHPRRFVLLPGHELDQVETVVENTAGYVVVEKRAEAGREAAITDPRS